MNNQLLEAIHLENKKRKRGYVEEVQLVVVAVEVQEVQVQVEKKHMLCLDLTGVEEEQEQEQGQEQPHVVVVRKARATRVLPAQDIEMLQKTEEEFGEIVRRHTSLDRLEKHRGDCKKNAITISEDMRCDCDVKCQDGYECFSFKHIMCKKMLTDDRKCYLCGSRVI